MDVSAARHVCGEHQIVVGAADSCGQRCSLAPDGRSDGPDSRGDVAAVAVRALSEEGHAGAEYVMTGPQSLSQSEQVHEIGRAIGRSLRVEDISPREARSELLSIMPAFVIEMLLDAWAAATGQPAFVTSTVAEITGTPALTFFDWATAHAEEFRGNWVA